jgi:hypothetical protein
MDTTSRDIHDCSLFWLGTDIEITSGGVKFTLWDPNPPS